jgi:hypothetical protein
VLAVVRLRATGDVVARGRVALAALAARPGFLGGTLGRATDDPDLWVLTTRWSSVGEYRRALSSWDVKMHAHPLLYEAVDEPSAFEELLDVTAAGAVTEGVSDRSPD